MQCVFDLKVLTKLVTNVNSQNLLTGGHNNFMPDFMQATKFNVFCLLKLISFFEWKGLKTDTNLQKQ